MPVIADRSRRLASSPVVIVGGGAAGIHAALACRRHYPDKPVTLVDAEAEIGYYRPLIPQYMLGKIDAHRLFFWLHDQDPLLTLRLNVNVASVDPSNRLLQLEDGNRIAYERLILTPGGRPFVPPVCTSRSCRLGVFSVRSLADAGAVRRWLPDHRHIAILGGGLVGVKTAVQFALAGYPTILVEREGHLLPNLLSHRAALPIANHLRRLGVDVRTAATIEDIRGDRNGELKEVRIGGEWTVGDTLLVAIGSTPELGFLESSGLIEDGELVVAPTLQTADRYVFAAGDAVTIRTDDGATYRPWTWPQAIAQGRLAGANIYRSAPLPLGNFSRVNAQNIAGLPLVVLGGRPERFSAVSQFGDPPRWWREWYLEKDRIVGGALVGDIAGAGPLHFRMTTGGVQPNAIAKPDAKAFARDTWRHLGQKRTVRYFYI
ncbi:MAG: FAD-dependent oxidoreductase [Deltaproteobacteria bacterium]|nr:FAD-dependent oxidoreductase [Deltaproteobacteria bacterium]